MLAPNPELQKILLKKLSHSVIIADWQYNAKEFFKEQGFKVLCCPWDMKDNIVASAKTIKEHKLLGVMHTTWNSLWSIKGIWAVAYSAALNWGECVFKSDTAYQGCEIGAILRKLDFPKGSYENSGWEKKQILD